MGLGFAANKEIYSKGHRQGGMAMTREEFGDTQTGVEFKSQPSLALTGCVVFCK